MSILSLTFDFKIILHKELTAQASQLFPHYITATEYEITFCHSRNFYYAQF